MNDGKTISVTSSQSGSLKDVNESGEKHIVRATHYPDSIKVDLPENGESPLVYIEIKDGRLMIYVHKDIYDEQPRVINAGKVKPK